MIVKLSNGILDLSRCQQVSKDEAGILTVQFGRDFETRLSASDSVIVVGVLKMEDKDLWINVEAIVYASVDRIHFADGFTRRVDAEAMAMLVEGKEEILALRALGLYL